MNHKTWIFFSGLLWFLSGFSLLYKGLRLIAEGSVAPHSLSDRLQGLFGSVEDAGTGLIAFGLLIGFLKGRFVLSKTVHRVVRRIRSLSLPIRLSQVYAPSYGILIGLMILLGSMIRFLPISMDLRGMIDVAIGSALIQGAILYFRLAIPRPEGSHSP